MASWFSFTKSVSVAVDVVNNIEVSKLDKICKRIIQTLHLKDESAFSAEEERKLEAAFELTDKQIECLLDTISFVFEQAAYHTAKPGIFSKQLTDINIEEGKIEAIINIWKEYGPNLIDQLRKRNFAPKQLESVSWQVNVQAGEANKTKQKEIHAQLEFCLAHPDTPNQNKRERLQMGFNHSELYQFFNQLETIQAQLDGLN